MRRLALKASMAVPWRLPSFRRRRWCCLRQASWFISGPRNGHLSGGTEKTRLAWRCPGPGSPGSPWTGAVRVRSWRSCITCRPAAGTGSGSMPSAASCAPSGSRPRLPGGSPRPARPGGPRRSSSRLRAANGGTLSGFFDVFAWREPGRAAFVEAKVGPDRIKPTQLRFAEIALRFRPLEEFMIVEIAGPSPQRTPARQPGTTAGQAAARRPVTTGPRSGGPDLQPALRRPAPAGPGQDASAVAAAPAHGAVDRGRRDQGGRVVRR